MGTTHRAVSIANSNKDLVGRISQIDVGHWGAADLKKICQTGFLYLHANVSQVIQELICNEAAGLPIIVQQSCQALFTMPGYDTIAKARKARISPKKQNANDALFYVAQNKYTQFENYYSTLIKGPREKARKYRTYELVLACFTLDPVQFSLSRRELDFRMQKLGLKTEEIPPAASLNSTLGALKSFQEKRELELIEWVPKEDKLYIVEPSFLFYVRWRRRKEASPQQLDLFEELLERLTARKISVWNAAE